MDRSVSTLLTAAAPVPIDRPFTSRWARAQGVDPRRLRAWVRAGLLVAPVHGVMHAAQLVDSLELRLECLRLVVPEDAVVTDRTAAWLHGAPMVLDPAAHRLVPRVDVFLLPGSRIRRAVARSGQRELFSWEIEELGGIRVTTPLRTMCDLGMKLPRKQAFAAMCSMLKVADFTLDDVSRQADGRFKGYRWVRQLRALAPLCDPRFESPGECILALIWLETPGLPPFEPQYRVQGPVGSYYLDFAVPELRYGAEYFGAEWHGESRAEADRARLNWLESSDGWRFGVFGADDVRGTGQVASDRLLQDIAEARRTVAARRRVVT
jgi:very-short-patch-repair endonuclease